MEAVGVLVFLFGGFVSYHLQGPLENITEEGSPLRFVATWLLGVFVALSAVKFLP